jgi:hypothetical protein
MGDHRTTMRRQVRDTQISREFINLAATLKDPVPYQPWAAEAVKKRRVEQGLDPNVHCMPRGAPRIWTDDYYKRIFEVPGRVIILTERNIQYRQIFTDGRPFPADPNPTWNGTRSAIGTATLWLSRRLVSGTIVGWMRAGILLRSKAK